MFYEPRYAGMNGEGQKYGVSPGPVLLHIHSLPFDCSILYSKVEGHDLWFVTGSPLMVDFQAGSANSRHCQKIEGQEEGKTRVFVPLALPQRA